jgi:hypothetical protein
VFPGKVPVPVETSESKFCVNAVPKLEILTGVVVSAEARRASFNKTIMHTRHAIATTRKRLRLAAADFDWKRDMEHSF